MSTTRDLGDFGDFGVVSFGNATKKKLKRPYKRSVVRKGRKLIGKKKIGHVEKSARNKFAYVTRGGSVWEATVSKKSGAREPAAKKAAEKAPKRKAAEKARKK